MICAPCAAAADAERRYQQTTGKPSRRPAGTVHKHPKACGCPCQHRAITPQPNTASTPTS